MIKVAMTSVFVDDVEKAHAFYTELLGFETRAHLDMGGALFVTVGAPGAQRDVELLLEPGDSDLAREYTMGLRAAGLPSIVLSVDDLAAEHVRLEKLGVRFTHQPSSAGPMETALLDDTVGNLVQLTQRTY